VIAKRFWVKLTLIGHCAAPALTPGSSFSSEVMFIADHTVARIT
jgi:hypothetical protein